MIFHESISAALTSYFPEKKNEAEFRKLFYTWWIISNSKVQFSNHIFGQAARKMTGNRNFVVHWQIGSKLGVMKGFHHLNNSFSACQLPRL